MSYNSELQHNNEELQEILDMANALPDASGGGGTSTEYETVDSVDQMTDTSKQYVLKETGTIWAYGEVETEGGKRYKNLYDPATMATGEYLNKRINSSGSYADAAGYVSTPHIPVSTNAGENVTVRLKGVQRQLQSHSYARILGYATNDNNSVAGTPVGNPAGNGWTVSEEADGVYAYSKSIGQQTNYWRFTICVGSAAITASDVSSLVITINEEIDETPNIVVVEKWYDTGITPSEAGGGNENYIELLVKINKNSSDIYEVGRRVTTLETESGSVTIPSFWQSAVDACIAKIKALRVGRDCVTFPFFSDNHQRNGYAGMLIAHIMKECHIPYCFYGGDSISNGTIADEATMIAQDKAFDTIMSYVPNGRMCRAVGNHDGYWYDGTNKYYYNRSQIYDLFLREESIGQNKHYGGEGTYYYIDDIASMVRWIVMDTNNASVDDAQIAWVQNTALSFDEDGWSAVFISHQPISNHYHAGITNASAVVSAVTSAATSKSVPIIGWFSGHIHRDRIYTGIATNTSDDTVGAAMGFTQVTITSDHTGIAYDSATKHTVANDDQSHAIDFVTINKATRTVNITRLGIGNDRSYTY